MAACDQQAGFSTGSPPPTCRAFLGEEAEIREEGGDGACPPKPSQCPVESSEVMRGGLVMSHETVGLCQALGSRLLTAPPGTCQGASQKSLLCDLEVMGNLVDLFFIYI